MQTIRSSYSFLSSVLYLLQIVQDYSRLKCAKSTKLPNFVIRRTIIRPDEFLESGGCDESRFSWHSCDRNEGVSEKDVERGAYVTCDHPEIRIASFVSGKKP